MTKLAPEWVRTSDPVIRSPARYRWTTAPALPLLGTSDSGIVPYLSPGGRGSLIKEDPPCPLNCLFVTYRASEGCLLLPIHLPFGSRNIPVKVTQNKSIMIGVISVQSHFNVKVGEQKSYLEKLVEHKTGQILVINYSK